VHTENRITWSEENPGKSVSGGFLFRDRRLSGHIYFFQYVDGPSNSVTEKLIIGH
jgi:phenolic acid decarboxylase